VRALAAGFFNDDRRPDILVTQVGNPGHTQVFAYAGGISFTATGQFDSGNAPTAVGVGVLDSANFASDRDADAVVASAGQLTFGIGDGAGSFRTFPDPFAVSASPQALSVVDIDGMGVQDVVTANADGSLSLLLSSAPPPTPTPTATGTATPTGTVTATGTASPQDTPTPTHTLRRSHTATRTATVTPTKEGVFALSGSGCSAGESGGRFPVEAAGGVILLGLVRLARRRRATARHCAVVLIASIAIGYAAPVPAQLTYTSCTIPRTILAAGSTGALRGVATGLLNGDIAPDLVLLYADRIAIELTDPDQFSGGPCLEAVTASTNEGTAGPVAVAIALIDGDQDADLAVATETNVALFLGDGAGVFTNAGLPLPSFEGPNAIAVGDLNGDSRSDLVVGDDTAIKILLGRVEAGYVVSSTLDLDTDTDSPVLAIRLADFNGDEDLDIAAVDSLGTVGVFLQQSDNTFPATPSLTETVDAPRDMQADDIGGSIEGDLALVTSARRLEVLLTTGGSLTLADGAALGGTSNLRGLALGRLDDDNRVDAVIADSAANAVHLLLGDGTGAFAQVGDPRSAGASPIGVALADLDNDGSADIITANQSSIVDVNGSITVFLSSNPEPTVTQTATRTPTITLTPSITPTVTVTTTPADTPTPTETPSITPIGTPTRTASASPTETFGSFAIQGEGCANNVGGSSGMADAMPLVVLAALALLRRRAKRA
jgi:hypothetical protein